MAGNHASGARRPLTARIAIGLAIGIAVGLFVGDRAAALKVVADAYINLLQMTVLPYVTVSIIGGLGALSAAEARLLGKRVGSLLLLIWAFSLAAVFLFPLMFPNISNASFFSTTLLEEREPFELLSLYIPGNPFSSLANNIVPAVVFFSIVVGMALMAVPGKEGLLDVLKIAAAAISKVTNFVVGLSPYGLGAIGALVAGTLRFEELQRLRVYLLSYAAVSLFLALWVLPGLVAALTRVPYRALLSSSRDALVMAFMTTSLFAVLPLLIEQAKALTREHAGVQDPTVTDVIVPASFSFPHAGKLLSLSFVLFGAWYADVRLPLSDYPRLAGAGLLAMFGSANAAVPFLLDLFRIPSDTFNLFVASGVINARFGTLVAAVHTIVIAVLGTCALNGVLTIDARKLIRFGMITAVLTVGVVGSIRVFLQEVLNAPYQGDQLITGMGPLRDRGQARVFTETEPPPPMPSVSTTVLNRVRDSGVLRVGYFDDSMPYAFVNQRGELVGFDVEMALQLARDLHVELELVRVNRTLLDADVDATVCDLVMSGAVITADRAMNVLYSSSYLDETVAFIVPDHLTRTFSDWASIHALGPLRLAVPRAQYYIDKIHAELADAEIVPVDRMDSIADLFTSTERPIDAFVATAERGSVYTLLHPEYSVVVPKPRPFRVPLAYVIAGRDQAMADLVNAWIDLKQRDGTIDELFGHWILGRDAKPRRARWSVMDDVLHF
jgi:Na+/H+-dicarboxylate symporter/ABC-type amino acid transport substrate-binding protein